MVIKMLIHRHDHPRHVATCGTIQYNSLLHPCAHDPSLHIVKSLNERRERRTDRQKTRKTTVWRHAITLGDRDWDEREQLNSSCLLILLLLLLLYFQKYCFTESLSLVFPIWLHEVVLFFLCFTVSLSLCVSPPVVTQMKLNLHDTHRFVPSFCCCCNH